MSNKNNDLPGFYRDPKTGKYFRDNPTAIKNRSLEKLKKANENQSKNLQESANSSKYSNIFKFLHHREMGHVSGLHSERDFCRMVTSNKKVINEYDLKTHELGNIVDVQYVRGTKSFVLTLWTLESGSSVITHQPLSTDHGFLCKKRDIHSVTDLCEGPDMTVISIYNDPITGGSGFIHLKLQHELSSTSLFLSTCSDPLYCCAAANNNRPFIAAGSHKYVYYYRPGNLIRGCPVFNGGRAHTICFNWSSNTMVTGIHTGHISVKDMRFRNRVRDLKISEYCINESYFLEPNQVIVAGLENVLCKVDLRMDKVVTEYFDHKTSTKKSALSVANNMLCATGSDNVVRIWHLSGGGPVHEINPQYSPNNKVRSWLFNTANKTYLYHFEAGIRKTFLLA